MNRIMLYQENACGMTGVSNVFIDSFIFVPYQNVLIQYAGQHFGNGG